MCGAIPQLSAPCNGKEFNKNRDVSSPKLLFIPVLCSNLFRVHINMSNILHSVLVTVIILLFIDTRQYVSWNCMTQSDSHQKAMSQVRRLPEENPERGTHCTFLAGRWQNSNSTKPPLIGQAYFSTCCGGRLLLVALPLSQEIVDSSNNCSLFEMQGYRFCPGNRNLAALIYSEIPNLFLKPCIHNSIIYIWA